ncbi:protein of unknown function [Taphrina deformans PYCC 5710]|uniref:Cep57 centrosome microtubule-binding domain-containing protein n=1 Tax=Taphrina deformans (strain PYCC 5710 / ATCC 11124 / CBS 356.35 / IMI 108563 / JCM 9778 / NBRC 8474) TaxID=1097556 RepID=R4XHL7_TAPDE|nr:protein of unknown function [Taphrina deformans PYCC 5710]|eukprot:CCG84018.1 protein of unknown function [Taphrina deformans PYCC 5710]
MSTRKVTALGLHESESEYSPSKYYQPARTPHGASRMRPQSMRKVSPKSFRDTAQLFKELGLEDSMQQGNVTTMQPGQSFRLPRDIPDLSTLMSSSRKAGHKVIESVPLSEDNQKLFVALQDLQLTIDALEQEKENAQAQMTKLRSEHKAAEEKCKIEQQRATFAENELKQYLATNSKSAQNDAQLKALESRNAALLNAYNNAKKDLENRTLELELARDEVSSVNEERNGAITRLANAHEKIDELTKENESLKKQIESLSREPEKAPTSRSMHREGSVDQRIDEQIRRQRSATPPAATIKSARKDDVDELDYSDEGIEVSKSILNDSEIEDLTEEIQETRRRNMHKAATKNKARKQDRTHGDSADRKPKSKPAPLSQVNRASFKRERKPSTGTSKLPTNRAKRAAPILELSEDDTFASGEDEAEDDLRAAGLLSSDDDEEEEEEILSMAEDEPSQILYRRKPVQLNRNRQCTSNKVNVDKVIKELSRHDSARCTICSRKAASNAKNNQARQEEEKQQQRQQGKTSGGRACDDANATIRPSQPPVPALHAVLAGLEDEFRHLKLKYHGLADNYNQLDPSLGKKKRKALASDLRTTIEALEGKADQIYAIFDVLEAAATGMSWSDEANERPQQTTFSGAAPRREWINT